MRLDGYVRVSQVRGRAGETFISPAVQHERIAAWAAAYGHELVHVHEELDESGARADRPLLAAALARIEAGETDGLIVAKLDRFGRSLMDGLQKIERIRNAGGAFVSVADGFDLTTDTGRLVLRIMLSLAEFELDRVRGNWADAKARAVMRGIHPSATAPFGYRREPATGGRLLVDQHAGPLVTEAFRRRADGEGLTMIGRWLGEHATTQWGRDRFSLRAVRDMIRNDVYLGVASAGDVRNPEAHEPLTDPITFRRAQRPGKAPKTTGALPGIARPLLRCAGCRYALRSERRRQARGDVWVYSCRSRSRDGAWRCDHPVSLTVIGDELDDLVAGRFLDGISGFQARARGAAPSIEPLEREEARQRALLEQWRDDSRVQERLGMDAYLAGLAARQAAHAGAVRDLAAARAAADAPELPVEASDLRQLWPKLSDEQRRELLVAGLVCVFVRGKQLGGLALEDRVRLVWRGEDVALPARGDREFVAHPFPFGDGHDGH